VIAGKRVMMMMAKPQVIPATVDVERLHSIMGATSVNTSFPVEIVSTGLPDIIMPLDNVEQLYSLAPNMDALAQLSKELGVTGVHAFAFGEDDYTAHVRNFGPLYGVPEESATGTANAALTHYLHQHGIIASGDSNRFLQGETMGRPSVVESTIDSNGTIWVGGECAIVATGTLLTNP
jgi:PhzF family phenazine biosynthesis protein